MKFLDYSNAQVLPHGSVATTYNKDGIIARFPADDLSYANITIAGKSFHAERYTAFFLPYKAGTSVKIDHNNSSNGISYFIPFL